MWMKYHVYWPQEMYVHEIVSYTISGNGLGNVEIQFPVERNVHTMNRKCEQSYSFLRISQPRKSKTSSSALYTKSKS